ncbi:MAG: hypothetical protein V3S37_03310 [Dehalococcoidia bacterium]
MAHIIILSEDLVFSHLLAQNLQVHEHQAEVYPVHQQLPTSSLTPPATSATTLWIIDLGWFDDLQEPTYVNLVDWCRHLSKPSILLVDGSWSQSQVQAFHATTTFTKPFNMSCLMQAVDQLSGTLRPEKQLQQ